MWVTKMFLWQLQLSCSVYITIRIRSLLSDIVHSTAIHYIGISEWVNEWAILDTAHVCSQTLLARSASAYAQS